MSNFVLAISFGVIGYVTWDLPIVSYFMVQLGVFGVFVAGAME